MSRPGQRALIRSVPEHLDPLERIQRATAQPTYLVEVPARSKPLASDELGVVVLPLSAMQAAIESVVRVAFDRALADRVAEAVATRLGAAATAEMYSTSKLGPHVPGKTRDWMLRHVKQMPGASKTGRDWSIARSDYLAWQRSQDATRVRLSTKRAIIEPDDDALAEEALRNAGYRPNGKKSR